MAYRVSRAALEDLVSQIAEHARALGLLQEGDQLILEIGSKADGTRYRLFKHATGPNGEPGRTSFLSLANNGFIGVTAKEADVVLRAIGGTLWAVVRAQSGK